MSIYSSITLSIMIETFSVACLNIIFILWNTINLPKKFSEESHLKQTTILVILMQHIDKLHTAVCVCVWCDKMLMKEKKMCISHECYLSVRVNYVVPHSMEFFPLVHYIVAIDHNSWYSQYLLTNLRVELKNVTRILFLSNSTLCFEDEMKKVEKKNTKTR